MDYKQKYKELVGKIKKAYLFELTDSTKAVLEDILPELVESEDERIRKAIIDFLWKEKIFLQEVHSSVENNPKYRFVMDAIAWLEKQGGQNPIINVPSREVILSIWDLGNKWNKLTNGSISTEFGDALDYIQKHWHESEYYLREKQSEEIKEVTCTHEVETGNGNIKALVTEKIQPLKFKVRYAGSEYKVLDIKVIAGITYYGIEDEPNHIDYVLPENCEVINGYGIKERGSSYPIKPVVFLDENPAWSEEDEKRYISLHNAIYVTQDCAVDSNKKKELSDFLDSLKNRVQQQSMQEWSEEDKKCTRLSTDIIDSALRAGFCVQIDRDRCVDWLKSLKQRIGG